MTDVEKIFAQQPTRKSGTRKSNYPYQYLSIPVMTWKGWDQDKDAEAYNKAIQEKKSLEQTLMAVGVNTTNIQKLIVYLDKHKKTLTDLMK